MAYIFALIFFGKKPIKKMMKYKKTESLDKRSSAIVNMTWDLYFMNMFFRDSQNKKENQELLYASSDNALKKTLETAIEYQLTNNLEVLIEHWDISKLKKIDQIYANLESIPRVYLSSEWTPEYRQKLIAKYELLLELKKPSS